MPKTPTTCPDCGTEVEIMPASYGLVGFSCPACGKAGVVNVPPHTSEMVTMTTASRFPAACIQTIERKQGRAQQLKLFGIERGKPTCRIEQAEESVQRQTIQALNLKGYIVLQTTVRYRFQKCPSCGRKHRPQGGYGATPGVPDLIITHPTRWYEGQALLIEMKGTKTTLSDAQKDLQSKGRIVVCRSMEEALRAASVFDYALSLSL